MAISYDPGRTNYSRQIVEIAPGSVVAECNFSQLVPRTAGVVCDGPLTLNGCNLWNCTIDARWTLVECQTAQGWLIRSESTGPDGSPVVGLDTQFVCSHPSQLPVDLIAPAGAVTEA